MADEYTSNGTVFYRVSDRTDDTTLTKDITLHTAFGDLSDGTAPALNVKAGKDSRMALLDFRVKPQPKYGSKAQMVGFDLNFVTASGDVAQNSVMPLIDVYKMKYGEEGLTEGAMKPVNDAHQTYDYAWENGSAWQRSDVAALLAYHNYDGTHKVLHEDFSGSSDISKTMYKYTSSGKVFAGTKPYITVKEAVENTAGFINKAKSAIQKLGGGNEASKVEMAGFYGSTNSDGETVVFLEPADENDPPNKWKPANPVGEKQDLLSHPAFAPTAATGVGNAGAVGAGAAGTYAGAQHSNMIQANTHMRGNKLMAKNMFLHTEYQQHLATMGPNKGNAIKLSNKSGNSAGMFTQVKSGPMAQTRYAVGKAPAKMLGGPLTMAIAAGTALYSGQQRAKDLSAARNAGDFSGLNRPYFEPTFKHKDIKNKIKYDKVFEDFTISERDETAMTVTSSWWDMIKEVKDYPKPTTGAGVDDATSITPGSTEDMMAKSSINFSNENSLYGGNMRMACYHDKDVATHPAEQLDKEFGGTINPLAQDIFVCKKNIPAPVKMFPDALSTNSVTNKEPTSKYEISFKLNIPEMAQQYTALSSNGSSTSSATPFRRGIAVVFSNKEPEENDSFADYIQRHNPTADKSNWDHDICGFVIENRPGIGSGGSITAQGMRVVPFAQVTADNNSTTDQDSDLDGSVMVNCQQSGTLTNDISFAQTSSGTASNADNIRIPAATWLEFKLSTDQSGASGQNYRRHGRFYLTVHHCQEEGRLVADQKEYNAEAEEGAFEGPMCLVSPNDCADGSGSGADLKLTNAHGDIDEPLNTTHWLKHMSIWVCNYGNMSGGSMNMDGTASSSASTRYIHDFFSAGTQNGGVEYDEAITTPKGYKPYFLAKTVAHFDDFMIKGASPTLINMSINSENPANIAGQNVINNDNETIIKPAYEPRWANLRGSGNTYEEKRSITPTVLALGFKTTTNLVGSLADPKFLLFNDFLDTAGRQLPTEVKDSSAGTGLTEMVAGFQDDTKKLGDFIDVHSTGTENVTTVSGSGLLNTTDPVTFNVNTPHDIEIGDILKVDSEHLEVTKVATNAITVNRGITSTDSVAAHSGGATVARIGQSLFKKFTIGNTDNNDIMTGPADTTDLAYSGTTNKTMYVNNFSQKGVLQFQNAFTNWTRRENIYASSRITSIPDGEESVVSNKALIEIADKNAIKYNEDELYIIYKYGTTATAATAFDNDSGTATIVKILSTNEDGRIEIIRDTSLGNIGGSSSKQGVYLPTLLTFSNLPVLFISPYRYWVNIMIDQHRLSLKGRYDRTGQTSAPTHYDYPKHAERAYGSILPIADPSSGYVTGTTFNEDDFFVNTSGKTFYSNARSFDITNKERAPYELNVDFGFGTFDNETASGGQVNTFRPTVGVNRIPIDNLMAASPEEDSMISLLMSSNGSNQEGAQLHFYSSNLDSSSFDGVSSVQEKDLIPQFVTKYLAQMPDHPGLAVTPNEVNPQYPEFTYTASGSDLWYGYLLISKEPIKSKYHGIVGYAPLNENTDTEPWQGSRGTIRGGNIKRMKLYGRESSINKDSISDTNVDVVYATTDGVYNSNVHGTSAGQVIDGLAGRALYTGVLGAQQFPYRAGYTNLSEIATGGSVVMHCIPDANASDGTLLEIKSTGTSALKIEVDSGKVKATLAPSSGTSTVVTSARTIPKDGETPVCIIVTFDPDILDGNIKLFMDGKLEAQSGPATQSSTASQWEYGNTFVGTGSNDYLQIGDFASKYEEILIYGNGNIIYPITFNDQGGDSSIIVEKNLEEIASVSDGQPQIYNARLFVFDYHNLRGDNVATSPEIAFRKAAFKIDGT